MQGRGLAQLHTYIHTVSLIQEAGSNLRSCFLSCNEFIRCFHESRIPNLQIFITTICYDFFYNWQTEKKRLFWTNKKFVFFFNCSNWKKILETNWWKHLMNSLYVAIAQHPSSPIFSYQSYLQHSGQNILIDKNKEILRIAHHWKMAPMQEKLKKKKEKNQC